MPMPCIPEPAGDIFVLSCYICGGRELGPTDYQGFVWLWAPHGSMSGFTSPSLELANALGPGHLVFRVEKFASISGKPWYMYQVLELRLQILWLLPCTHDWFPKTRGMIPVSGFGTTVHSAHDIIRLDPRIYGSLTTARYRS
jgi:hypothetical protein